MVFATVILALKKGHVAVVTDIVSKREIRVDQANWQNHGEIDHATPVLDVSARNDWSQVRVWDMRSKAFGGARLCDLRLHRQAPGAAGRQGLSFLPALANGRRSAANKRKSPA